MLQVWVRIMNYSFAGLKIEGEKCMIFDPEYAPHLGRSYSKDNHDAIIIVAEVADDGSNWMGTMIRVVNHFISFRAR